jgi:hypothetical protein
MKTKKPTKEENNKWGYTYLLIGFILLVGGILLSENYWLYTFSVIMFLLGSYKLLWLSKKL